MENLILKQEAFHGIDKVDLLYGEIKSFNRISIFERRPQTPLNQIPINRYSKYYNSGLIDQGIRYGSRAFQGLFFQGSKVAL